MMFGLICIAVVVGCSVAEQLCPPASWRAEEVSAALFLPKVDHEYQPRREEDHALVYYDADQQKTALVANYSGATGNGDIKIIYDYAAKKEYRIDLAKNTCKSKALTDPFKKWCISDDATFLYDAKIGFSSDGSDTVTAKVYYVENVYSSHTIGHVIAITSDLNVPVQSSTFGRGGDLYLDIALTGNIASPIPEADANVFTPPDSCSSSYFPEEELEVLRVGALRRLFQ
ncbi:uncharacterized protein LOC124264377 [Haliotis rubra]|uniref:uncharacterized protein LOC124264377 n=1 Tax=Haliotis rubra TaxID=36100 RepID=UPI001EE56C27|nr:uncharacterized protein LOC124264377 [Haliotis rubra]